ncbi:MAG: hypothetical protein ACK56W_11085 [Pirellula sp.]|jgi:hypothetical protein|nr:hypothetical protein [Pirellula sp.]
MQIPSSNWPNPAAHALQTASHARTPHSTTTQNTPTGVNALEHAEKTGDRDANERYDGPPGNERKHSAPRENETNPIALASLPADDGEQHELDIQG